MWGSLVKNEEKEHELHIPTVNLHRCPSCGQPTQLVQTLAPKWQQERLVAVVGEPSSCGPPLSGWKMKQGVVPHRVSIDDEIDCVARRTWLHVLYG
jgi:hypothetical protein